MAKKVLTPEEVQAKIEKKAAKRKLFFGTFTKSLAFFLAIAMVFSLAMIAFTPEIELPSGNAVQSGNTSNGFEDYDDDFSNSQTPNSDSSNSGGSSTGSTDNTGSTGDNAGSTGGNAGSTGGNAGSTGGNAGSTGGNAGSTGGNAGSTGGNAGSTGGNAGSTGGNAGSTGGNAGSTGGNAGNVAAEAIAAINAETAKAAKGNYKWNRVSAFTPDGAIDVGNATGTLNKIIKGVDENADLNSVVGGFLGIGTKEAQVTGGKVTPDTGMHEQHLLVGTKLTANDVTSAKKDGDTYIISLPKQRNPQKDGSNALSHATNDFFTESEVQKGIADAVGSVIKVESSTVDYYNIQIKATIKDGKLTTYELSYEFAATLNLRALAKITGNGKATNNAVYSNINY